MNELKKFAMLVVAVVVGNTMSRKIRGRKNENMNSITEGEGV